MVGIILENQIFINFSIHKICLFD